MGLSSPSTRLTSPRPPQPQRQWRRLYTRDAAFTADPSSILVGATDSAAETSIEVLGGTTTTHAQDGALWAWPCMSLTGAHVSAPDIFCSQMLLEIVTAPGETTDLWVHMGLVDITSSDFNLVAGYVWDSAGGPHLRASNSAATNTAVQDAGHKFGIVEVQHEGMALTEVHIDSWDSGEANIGKTSRGALRSTSQPLYWCLAAGRTTTIAGNATAGIRAYYKPFVEARGVSP